MKGKWNKPTTTSAAHDHKYHYPWGGGANVVLVAAKPWWRKTCVKYGRILFWMNNLVGQFQFFPRCVGNRTTELQKQIDDKIYKNINQIHPNHAPIDHVDGFFVRSQQKPDQILAIVLRPPGHKQISDHFLLPKKKLTVHSGWQIHWSSHYIIGPNLFCNESLKFNKKSNTQKASG